MIVYKQKKALLKIIQQLRNKNLTWWEITKFVNQIVREIED